jgi:uncharacterized protein (TIGR02145 family)
VVKNLCGTATYEASQFCYNNSELADFCGTRTVTYNPDIYQCKPSINANGIYLKTPLSDGTNNYEAVLIGTQTWMAENLNYAATGTGNLCYSNTAAMCNTYGRLYNWTTAMAGAASSTANPSGVIGVCPSGWHLPSRAEWDVLMSYVQTNNGRTYNSNDYASVAGKYLKAASGWNNGNGEDKYGFAARPGGTRSNSGNFGSVESTGYWWTASEYNSSIVNYWYMGNSYEDARWGSAEKSTMYSVRCVMN